MQAFSYIERIMRLYYRAYYFSYRYSFTEERAGETRAVGVSKAN